MPKDNIIPKIKLIINDVIDRGAGVVKSIFHPFKLIIMN